jgi:hypothetical protein
MKTPLCKSIAASLACLPMILPPSALAAAPQPTRVQRPHTHLNPRQSVIVDVALRDRGQLSGRVVIADGTAVAGAPVSLAYRGQDIARTATDTQGRFALVGLRGGVYQFNTPGSTRSVRLWAPRTAPPAAQQVVTLVVQPQPVVRGQSIDAGGPGLITKSLIVGGVVATAVAVPLATRSRGHSGGDGSGQIHDAGGGLPSE